MPGARPSKDGAPTPFGRWSRGVLAVGLVAMITVPAYASHLVVRTNDIVDEAVSTRKLRDDAVTTRKLRNGAVVERKIRDDAVSTDKLQPRAVTFENLHLSALRAFHTSPNNGPDDIPQAGEGTANVMSLDLPDGQYIVLGRVALVNQDGSDGATVRCTMIAQSGGITIDSYPLSLAPGESKVMPLHGFLPASGGKTVTVLCHKGGSDTARVDVIEDPRLSAFKMAGISNQ